MSSPRFRVPEVVLGALLTFAAVLIWNVVILQKGPPQGTERSQVEGQTQGSAQGNEKAKRDQRTAQPAHAGEEGHAAAQQHASSDEAGSEHNTAEEAIAYYTLWLTGFTGVLALATIGLGGATVLLWRETKNIRLLGHKQSKDTENAIRFAEESAKAAYESVVTQKLAMVVSNRAYVHHGGMRWFSHNHENTGKYFWRIRPRWINTGNTPTRNLRIAVAYAFRDTPLPDDFEFPLPTHFIPTGIPAHGTIESIYYDLFGDDLLAVALNTKYFYVWGAARYHDMFLDTPEHITKFCVYAANVSGETTIGYHAETNPVEIIFAGYPRHNCADEDCEREPQHTGTAPEPQIDPSPDVET